MDDRADANRPALLPGRTAISESYYRHATPPAGFADRLDWALVIALAAGLAWAPFWLGGDRHLPWGVNAIFFPALVVLHEGGLIVCNRTHPHGLGELRVPALLFLASVAFVIAQVSPYVPTSLAHPIWPLAADNLRVTLPATISINPGASARALARLLTDASVFWLALQLGRDDRRTAFLLHAIVTIVAAYSAYGVCLVAYSHGSIPFFEVPPTENFVRSTFVNRNSFATYAGLGFLTVFGLILQLHRDRLPAADGDAWRGFNGWIEATERQTLVWIAAALIILVALLGSGCRAGIFATGLGFVALAMLSQAPDVRRRGERTAALSVLCAAVLTVFIFFGDRVVGRVAEVGLTDSSRLSVDGIVLRAILDAPLLGSGYGAFADVFPIYRDRSISPVGTWDMAHNTYFEVWLGLGLVFGTALIASLVGIVAKCFIGALRRRHGPAAPVVATAVSLLVGAHAWVDFSLQIEAVALTYSALLGVGLAQAQPPRPGLRCLSGARMPSRRSAGDA